eukprot:TRINITY_DN14946_c0_g1_i1.p1 TRINITY_DN14946_c0_g1~~TRINITY_DN14946_c0_g1_i1.p1  ORF type:complete len:778 (-),score=184.60 TRINITY_DN14946_c0_g1_i1:215-2548(-)
MSRPLARGTSKSLWVNKELLQPPLETSGDFIDGLPKDGLLPWEASLRLQLLQTLQEVMLTPFPLAQWIDRRIGGEVETCSGGTEIRLRAEEVDADILEAGAGAEAARGETVVEAEFFDGLPAALAPEEDTLRDALFDVLASQSEVAAASVTLDDLETNMTVQEGRMDLGKNFGCPDWTQISLAAWITRRLSNDLTLKEKTLQLGDKGSGVYVLQLSSSCREEVRRRRMLVRKKKSAAGEAEILGSCGLPLSQWWNLETPGPTEPYTQVQTEVPPVMEEADECVTKAVFYASLPENEFTEEEMQLRDSIYDVIVKRKPSDGPISLQDICSDEGVKCGRIALAAAGCVTPWQQIGLDEWMKKRIAGELSVRNQMVSPTEEGQEEVDRRKALITEEDPANLVSKVQFWENLPADEFNKEELALREAIYDVVARFEAEEREVELADLSADEEVRICRVDLAASGGVLLWKQIGLAEWLKRRMAGEVSLNHKVLRVLPAGQEYLANAMRKRRVARDIGGDSVGASADGGTSAASSDVGAVVSSSAVLPERNIPVSNARLGGFAPAGRAPPAVSTDAEKKPLKPLAMPVPGSVRVLTGPAAPPLASPWRNGKESATSPSTVESKSVNSDKLAARLAAAVSPGPYAGSGRSREGTSRPASATSAGSARSSEGTTRPGLAAGVGSARSSEDRQKAFFASLPANSFAPGEEVLRKLLLDIVDRWHEPLLAHVAARSDISAATRALLPPSCDVQLADWILNRVGGELEVVGGRLLPVTRGAKRKRWS